MCVIFCGYQLTHSITHSQVDRKCPWKGGGKEHLTICTFNYCMHQYMVPLYFMCTITQSSSVTIELFSSRWPRFLCMRICRQNKYKFLNFYELKRRHLVNNSSIDRLSDFLWWVLLPCNEQLQGEEVDQNISGLCFFHKSIQIPILTIWCNSLETDI